MCSEGFFCFSLYIFYIKIHELDQCCGTPDEVAAIETSIPYDLDLGYSISNPTLLWSFPPT